MQPDRKAKILIVDDHPIVRQGIAMLINREPGLDACCEASDAQQAIAANLACPHDLAIVDLSLAGASGLELVKQLRAKFHGLAILMMSMHDEAVYAERALRAGAHGYLMKQEATATMLTAIGVILRGELYVSDRMRSRLLQQKLNGDSAASPIAGLTASEFEVLNLIGTGLGTSEIADRLKRSVKTIESHRANIRKKLNLRSGNELARFAINWVNGSAIGAPPA
ncbi:MAG: response regulator [Betaproteobacteria bacterium]